MALQYLQNFNPTGCEFNEVIIFQIIDFGFARRLSPDCDVIAGQGTPEFVSPGPRLNDLEHESLSSGL